MFNAFLSLACNCPSVTVPRALRRQPRSDSSCGHCEMFEESSPWRNQRFGKDFIDNNYDSRRQTTGGETFQDEFGAKFAKEGGKGKSSGRGELRGKLAFERQKQFDDLAKSQQRDMPANQQPQAAGMLLRSIQNSPHRRNWHLFRMHRQLELSSRTYQNSNNFE